MHQTKSDNKEEQIQKKDEDFERTTCPYCNQDMQPYWESKYNGIKGRCKTCETTWNLS